MEDKKGILEDFLPQLKNLIQAETVFGEPYEVGGVSIIPVNSVKVGFGFGSGKGPLAKENSDGLGGGGGVLLTPIAFLAVKDGEVSIHNLAAGSVENIMEKVPQVLEKLFGLMSKSGKKEPDPS